MNDQETIKFLHRLYTKFVERDGGVHAYWMFPSFIGELPLWFDSYFHDYTTWKEYRNYIVHGRFGPQKNIPF